MFNRVLLYVAAIVIAVTSVITFPGIGIAAEPNAPAPLILDKIPPTWSQKLPGDQRFEVVLDGEGVLDKETGLVWQQSPNNSQWTWAGAIAHCSYFYTGGRYGWHLPTVEQLTSLIDRSVDTPLKLPAGHPFGQVEVSVDFGYWTASTYPGAPDFAFEVVFSTADFGGADKGTNDRYVWCVRGGQSYNAY